MSSSSFQKEPAASYGPTESSPLNAPLQQYPLLYAAPSKRTSCLPSYSSNVNPATTITRGQPEPAADENRWTNPLASSDSCSAG